MQIHFNFYINLNTICDNIIGAPHFSCTRFHIESKKNLSVCWSSIRQRSRDTSALYQRSAVRNVRLLNSHRLLDCAIDNQVCRRASVTIIGY
jgi:hypothetical protein